MTSALINDLYALYLKCPVVTLDSRRVSPGSIFFGLKGTRVDGSEYGNQALDNGAAAAVVCKDSAHQRKGMVTVDEPLEVLQLLAALHRSHLNIPVIAITGSNGKTTTKELLSLVLSTALDVYATQGNLNNHIGVPLTLLSIGSAHEIAIVEMGANHIGEIRHLCALAAPTHGIVTNIGQAHLEGFGGLEGVKRAKAELYGSLAATGGTALVNGDERYLLELSAGVPHRVIYRAGPVPGFREEQYDFVYTTGTEGGEVTFKDADGLAWVARTTLFGEFNVANVATAIAAGLYFHIPGDQICSAIASYYPNNNRAQTIGIGTNTVILDAYNANPSSMHVALRSFANMPQTPKLIVLGAMMELGKYTHEAHQEVAAQAIAIKNASVMFIGDAFREVAQEYGVPWYPNTEALAGLFGTQPPKHTLILLKGSRAMHLESLLAAFH